MEDFDEEKRLKVAETLYDRYLETLKQSRAGMESFLAGDESLQGLGRDVLQPMSKSDFIGKVRSLPAEKLQQLRDAVGPNWGAQFSKGLVERLSSHPRR